MEFPFVKDLLPKFFNELTNALAHVARPELAEQLVQLRVVDRCDCGDRNCAHFYTAPKPIGPYGPGHANLVLPVKRGLVVLDIVDGLILGIEVLDRPDVKAPLDGYLKIKSSSR